jgi:hypothetical protein
LEAILRYVVQAFDVDTHYSEEQVNEKLSRFHDDVASLRRELIGFGLMERTSDGKEYWRVENGK